MQGQKYQRDVLRSVITVSDKIVLRQHSVTVLVSTERNVGAALLVD